MMRQKTPADEESGAFYSDLLRAGPSALPSVSPPQAQVLSEPALRELAGRCAQSPITAVGGVVNATDPAVAGMPLGQRIALLQELSAHFKKTGQGPAADACARGAELAAALYTADGKPKLANVFGAASVAEVERAAGPGSEGILLAIRTLQDVPDLSRERKRYAFESLADRGGAGAPYYAYAAGQVRDGRAGPSARRAAAAAVELLQPARGESPDRRLETLGRLQALLPPSEPGGLAVAGAPVRMALRIWRALEPRAGEPASPRSDAALAEVALRVGRAAGPEGREEGAEAAMMAAEAMVNARQFAYADRITLLELARGRDPEHAKVYEDALARFDDVDIPVRAAGDGAAASIRFSRKAWMAQERQDHEALRGDAGALRVALVESDATRAAGAWSRLAAIPIERLRAFCGIEGLETEDLASVGRWLAREAQAPGGGAGAAPLGWRLAEEAPGKKREGGGRKGAEGGGVSPRGAEFVRWLQSGAEEGGRWSPDNAVGAVFGEAHLAALRADLQALRSPQTTPEERNHLLGRYLLEEPERMGAEAQAQAVKGIGAMVEAVQGWLSAGRREEAAREYLALVAPGVARGLVSWHALAGEREAPSAGGPEPLPADLVEALERAAAEGLALRLRRADARLRPPEYEMVESASLRPVGEEERGGARRWVGASYREALAAAARLELGMEAPRPLLPDAVGRWVVRRKDTGAQGDGGERTAPESVRGGDGRGASARLRERLDGAVERMRRTLERGEGESETARASRWVKEWGVAGLDLLSLGERAGEARMRAQERVRASLPPAGAGPEYTKR